MKSLVPSQGYASRLLGDAGGSAPAWVVRRGSESTMPEFMVSALLGDRWMARGSLRVSSSEEQECDAI